MIPIYFMMADKANGGSSDWLEHHSDEVEVGGSIPSPRTEETDSPLTRWERISGFLVGILLMWVGTLAGVAVGGNSFEEGRWLVGILAFIPGFVVVLLGIVLAAAALTGPWFSKTDV